MNNGETRWECLVKFHMLKSNIRQNWPPPSLARLRYCKAFDIQRSYEGNRAKLSSQSSLSSDIYSSMIKKTFQTSEMIITSGVYFKRCRFTRSLAGRWIAFRIWNSSFATCYFFYYLFLYWQHSSCSVSQLTVYTAFLAAHMAAHEKIERQKESERDRVSWRKDCRQQEVITARKIKISPYYKWAPFPWVLHASLLASSWPWCSPMSTCWSAVPVPRGTRARGLIFTEITPGLETCHESTQMETLQKRNSPLVTPTHDERSS